MPDEKRRYYVHIEPIDLNVNSVRLLSHIDFIGWAYSQVLYIHKLSSKAKHITIWPSDAHDILNRIFNLPEYYSEDSEFTKMEYGSEENRERFIRSVRLMESTLVKCSLSYMVKVAELERWAIDDLYAQGIGGKQKETMTATSKYFVEKKATFKGLEALHGKKELVNEGIGEAGF
jgi:hypothetical protein